MRNWIVSPDSIPNTTVSSKNTTDPASSGTPLTVALGIICASVQTQGFCVINSHASGHVFPDHPRHPLLRTATGLVQTESELLAPGFLIDVSIVSHDSARWLPGLIDSLLAGSFPSRRICIHVHDNGSTDGSADLAADLAREYGSEFAAFHVDQGPNLGFGCAQNHNLKRADSPFFVVLNPDLELPAEALSAIIEFARLDVPETAAWEFCQTPFEHPKPYDPVTLETGWVSAAACVFRTASLKAVGGFDPAIFLYGEDVDLSWRLRARGARLRYVPWAACRHFSYSRPGQVKAAQLQGAVTANILLRLRFGSLLDLLWLPVLIMAAIVRGSPACSRWSLLQAALKALPKAPRFVFSRPGYRGSFQWQGLGFESSRCGAYEPLPEAPASAPLISVVVRTTPGAEHRLHEALQSLLNQTWPNLEIVVVEDGADQAGALCDRLDGQGDRRIHHYGIEAVGRSRAGNFGLSKAQGELLAFLDDDDLLYADHLTRLAAVLENNSDGLAAFAPAFEELIEIEDSQHWQLHLVRRQIPWHCGFSRALLQYVNYLPIQSVLFRRELFDQHGGLDEQLDMLEDWDLWSRYAMVGDFIRVNRVTSIFRTLANWKQRRSREQDLRSAQKEVRQRNLERCRQAGQDNIAQFIEQTISDEHRRWKVLPLIRSVCSILPGGSLLYEKLVARRRHSLAARAMQCRKQ
jgi:GT2 family glycosyltransferase